MSALYQSQELVIDWGLAGIVRVSVWLTLVLGAVGMLRRHAAALRHFVLTAGMVGSLLLLVLPAVAPSLPILPRWEKAELPRSLVKDARSNIVTEAFAKTDLPLTFPDLIDGESVAPQMGRAPVDRELFIAPPALTMWQSLDWRIGLVSVWLAGSICGLLPLMLGRWSLWTVEQQARPFTPILQRQLQSLAQVAGVRRTMRGLLSPNRPMPMTWGMWQPVLLLPEEATQWSTARLRLVFLHELAHIRRGDCLSQMLGQVVRAIYWFHPLAWWTLTRLREEQEAACDDSVLNAGESAEDYAAELLAVCATRSELVWEPAVALAIARPSRLERRIMAILDASCERHPLTLKGVCYAMSLITLLLFTIGGARPIVAAPLPIPQLAVVALVEPAPPEADTKTRGQAEPATAAEPQTVPQPPAVAESPAPQSGSPDRGVQASLSEIAQQIEALSAIPVKAETLQNLAIKAMVDSLKDPYAEVLTEEQFRALHQQIDSKVVGIGAAMTLTDQKVVVLRSIPNSPAAKGGLRANDVVESVDDQPVTDLPTAIQGIRGQAGTEVRLAVRRGDALVNLTLVRGEIALPVQRGLTLNEQGTPEYWLDPVAKIGYLAPTQFGPQSATEMKSTLDQLHAEGLKGLVLDLRDCPGGTLPGVIDVAKLFVKEATVVEVRSKHQAPGVENNNVTTYRTEGPCPFAELPLLVIHNGGTASAAEVLTAALGDASRAVLLGDRTYGKGSVQAILPLADGTIVKLTIGHMLRPNGKTFDRAENPTAWGVDPLDGFYVPLTKEQQQARVTTQRQVGDGHAKLPAPWTPEAAEQELADPQLAAAWRAMLGKLSTGTFTHTGRPLAELKVPGTES